MPQVGWNSNSVIVLRLVQLDSSGPGARLPAICVRAGLPHRQALLLHRREPSENVRNLTVVFNPQLHVLFLSFFLLLLP